MYGISISTTVILGSFAFLIGYVLHADTEYRRSGSSIWIYKMLAVTAGYMILLWFLRFSPLSALPLLGSGA